MKLGALQKLMATLAMEINDSKLHQMLSKPDFHEWEKGTLTSPISMLATLKMKCSSNAAFLDRFERLLEGMSDAQELANIVRNFREKNADLESTSAAATPFIPNGAFSHRPSKQQKADFKSTMLRISNSLERKMFEIIRTVSPIPEGRKESLKVGYKLFEALQTHGCISENDVELLSDFFTHLNLAPPLTLLREYQDKYPPWHYVPQPSAPVRGPSPQYLRSQYPPHSQHPHLSPSPQSFFTSHTTPSHTLPSFPVQGGIPTQEVNPPPSLPPPGLRSTPQSRDPTDPLQRTPLTSEPHPKPDPPSSSRHPVSPSLLPASQASAMPATPAATRGGAEHTSLSNPFQPESSTEQETRPPPRNPMFNPVQPFLRQNSPATLTPVGTHSILPPTPSAPRPPIITSPATSSTTQRPPLYQPPSMSPSHTTLPPPSSASVEHMSESTFPEALSCQSTGDRTGFASPPSQPPVAAGGSCSSRTTSYGYGFGRPSHSLPQVDENEDKLVAKRSRQMSQVTHSELTNRAGLPHCPPQRNVLTKEDIHRGIASSGNDNLPSINLPVSRELENARNNQYGQPGLPPVQSRAPSTQTGSSATYPRPSNDQHLCEATQPGNFSHHPPPHTPTPTHPHQLSGESSFVSGISSSSPVANSSGGRGCTNTPDPCSSLSSHADPSPFSSHQSPHSAYRVCYTSHEPSTRGLVNRQPLESRSATSSSRENSSSFAALPEEEGKGRESDDRNQESGDSSESEPSPVSLPTKRTREETSAGSELSPSSGDEDGDELSNAKRARREEHEKSGSLIGTMLRSIPIINRLWSKEKESESDSDSEHFEDAHDN